MSPVEIVCVAGARPNFMKVAAVLEALDGVDGLRPTLVHTGQHYDPEMSEVFFEDLGLPRPDVHLEVGSDTHARQTARVMVRFEEELEERSPGLVLVVGDVNSTLACTLVAAKASVPVAHVEAGLRSRDRSMPEEINRLVTDDLADFLFAPDRGACENLRAEGIEEARIHFVGNVMVDTLLRFREAARASGGRDRLEVDGRDYALVTLHRPSNVEDPGRLAGLAGALAELGDRLPVLFPAHPRTRESLTEHGITPMLEDTGVRLLEPLGYLEFLDVMEGARVVLTDSGGIQEETTVLGVPCLTIRENTERPVTVEQGTNVLVGTAPERVLAAAHRVLDEGGSEGRVPELWDGRAGERIVAVLEEALVDGGAGS